MQLDWNRTKIANYAAHETVTSDGTHYLLKSVGGSFFLYINGEQHRSRAFWNKLRDAKSVVQRIEDNLPRPAGHRDALAVLD